MQHLLLAKSPFVIGPLKTTNSLFRKTLALGHTHLRFDHARRRSWCSILACLIPTSPLPFSWLFLFEHVLIGEAFIHSLYLVPIDRYNWLASNGATKFLSLFLAFVEVCTCLRTQTPSYSKGRASCSTTTIFHRYFTYSRTCQHTHTHDQISCTTHRPFARM